jgi:hypothetical protein
MAITSKVERIMAERPGRVRKSTLFLGVVFVGGCLLCLAIVLSCFHTRSRTAAVERMRAQVAVLRLTDLCLFTEARYTRNPSQADLASAFQDHPFSFEHFPAGSFGKIGHR